SAGLTGFLGGLSIVMAGLGIGWVNAAADYSRYLPRSSSPGAVVWWTTFGASVAPVILIVFGVFVAAGNPQLATSVNPIAVLAKDLPTWFLVPYLLTLGLRIPRYQSVAIDGALMLAGNIYILFSARDFFTPFQGFLITLGVLL